MYNETDPITLVLIVCVDVVARAMPKSVTFTFPSFDYDNILRFDISVNDMLVMSCLKAGHHLNGDTDRLLR